MTNAPPQIRETPSQTSGPYVHIGCAPATCGVHGLYPTDLGREMLAKDTPGERIQITGLIYDGGGDILKDALIEIWQADHLGVYVTTPWSVEPSVFTGWGRQITDLETGRFTFVTIKPGAVQDEAGHVQAPHVSFWIVARGINLGLNTRMYFPEDAEANERCQTLQRVPPDLRKTLVAQRDRNTYNFDIYLQGPNETVFFDI